jgi:hypothetical protein
LLVLCVLTAEVLLADGGQGVHADVSHAAQVASRAADKSRGWRMPSFDKDTAVLVSATISAAAGRDGLVPVAACDTLNGSMCCLGAVIKSPPDVPDWPGALVVTAWGVAVAGCIKVEW